MKRLFANCLLLLTQASVLHAQKDTATFYQRKSYMISMRDGVKLFTVVLSPVNFLTPVPILLTRTPYGVDIDIKEDSSFLLIIKAC